MELLRTRLSDYFRKAEYIVVERVVKSRKSTRNTLACGDITFSNTSQVRYT